MILKGIFELITDPLGLPIEWYWEYIILCIIMHNWRSVIYNGMEHS